MHLKQTSKMFSLEGGGGGTRANRFLCKDSNLHYPIKTFVRALDASSKAVTPSWRDLLLSNLEVKTAGSIGIRDQ